MRCIICNSNSSMYDCIRDYEYRIPHCITLHRCDTCGSIRHGAIPNYESIARFYPDDYFIHNASFREGSGRLFSKLKDILYGMKAKRVVKYIGKSGNILDIGCANGAFLKSVRGLGEYNLYGLDIKDTGIDFKKESITFRKVAFEDMLYPYDYFNAIVLDNLIEHVPNPSIFLKKVLKVLKPGGYVFGTTPNFNSIDRIMFGKYWGGFHMPRHIYIFNHGNLEVLLRKTGFEKVRFPVTLNAGSWAVGVQNYCRRNKPRQKKYRRSLYFPIIGIGFAPIAFIGSMFNINGVMDFIARKPESK